MARQRRTPAVMAVVEKKLTSEAQASDQAEPGGERRPVGGPRCPRTVSPCFLRARRGGSCARDAGLPEPVCSAPSALGRDESCSHGCSPCYE